MIGEGPVRRYETEHERLQRRALLAGVDAGLPIGRLRDILGPEEPGEAA